MKKFFLFFYFLFIVFNLSAQQYDKIWITGYSSATKPDTSIFGTTFIDFNYKPAKVIRNWIDMDYDKATTTFSNEQGGIIFSTNGKKMIGKDLLPVKNGDTVLNYEEFKYGLRSEQGVLALPMPNNSNKFYMIYGYRLLQHTYPVYYSIFNSQLGKNGEIITKNEKTIQDSMGVGRIAAVKHGNGRDWWVHLRKEDNTHIWLLLDNKNLKESHRQKFGEKLINGLGQSVFSPDGKTYVECNSVTKTTGEDIDIYDFNRCDALLSNHRKIHFDSISWCGCAISPNSRYLYFSNSLHILQYDLYASDIKASETIVANLEYFVDFTRVYFYLMQLAPDGKIYVNSTGGCRYMHTIENPDEKGIACNVKQRSIKLFTYNKESIPNHPNYRLGALKGSPCDTLKSVTTQDIDNQELVQIFPNPTNDILNISVANNNPATLIIRDISSRVIESITFTTQTTISTANYFNGMIFCEIWQDNQRISTERIVIQH